MQEQQTLAVDIEDKLSPVAEDKDRLLNDQRRSSWLSVCIEDMIHSEPFFFLLPAQFSVALMIPV